MEGISGFSDWITASALYDPAHPLFFTAGFFFAFFSLFFMVYLLFGKSTRNRSLVILLFSLWFYYKCSGWFTCVIISAAALNYVVANIVGAMEKSRRRTGVFTAGLILNLLLLASFKYSPVFRAIASQIGTGHPTVSALVFPAGISFFTFANLSYIIDVRKRALIPERSFLRYLTYITFFPVVQMGPIERAKSFLPQLNKPFLLSGEDVSEGFYLILSGAFKKMVMGDYINLHLVSQVFGTPERYTGMENLAAMVGYSLVIYCDFSGYTDMARGIARWMGFNIQLNFNFPYRSEDIGEFWRRWHISLSNWLRDYIFMPMAFRLSRLIKQEYIFALSFLRADIVIFGMSALVTFTICGLWHGIGTNFLVWGLLHGAALAIHRLWNYSTRGFRKGMGPMFRRVYRITGIILTFSFVSIAWVFFRMRSPEESLVVLAQVAGNFYLRGLPSFISAYYPVLLMMAAGYALHFMPGGYYQYLRSRLVPLGWPWKALIAIGMITLIVYFKTLGSAMPIYIQF